MGDPTLTDERLYGPSGQPQASDIRQNLLGDCYFVAPLGALATQQPGHIQDAIHYDPTTSSFTVTLYEHGHGGFLGLKDEPKPVQIEVTQADLQTDMVRSNNLARGPAPAIWPAVMEAAYAKMGQQPNETMDDRLNKIGDGGWPKNAIYALTGESPMRVSAHDAKQATPEKVFDQLDGALKEGRPVLLTTNYVRTVPTDGLIQGDNGVGHAYIVEGVSKDAQGNVTMSLRNPWGHNHAPGQGIDSLSPTVQVDLKTVLDNGHLDELDIGPKARQRTHDHAQEQPANGDPKQSPPQASTGDPAMDRLLASLNDPSAMGQSLTALAQSPDGQAFHAQGQAQFQAMESQQAQAAQLAQAAQQQAPVQTGPVMVR